MSKEQYVLGIDFGSDSMRALLADAYTGKEIASEVKNYPRWEKGLYSNPSESKFRHHPLDYIEVLEASLSALTSKHKEISKNIIAISIDTTASTPCFVDEKLTPLSLKDEFKEDPDAMFILWKDHTAEKESNEINNLLKKSDVNYAREMGNYYTPEGYWAKVLHILRTNEKIRKTAFSCIELCDYLPALLTGCNDIKNLKCGHCIAGVKMMYSEDWNGFPPQSFFEQIDPLLIPILKTLPKENYTCDKIAGKLTKEWAKKFGLNEGILIGVGNVDSHSGGVGGGVCHGTLVMNLGTSAGYMTVMPKKEMDGITIDGVYGQVDSSILPGMIGYESGLSAMGDCYAWLKKLLLYNVNNIISNMKDLSDDVKMKIKKECEDQIIIQLTKDLEKLKIDEKFPISTDWFNGRRSPKTNNALKATITNLNLSSSAPEIFYALAEATAFASKRIIDHLKDNGVVIKRLIAIGGVAQKSPFVMQLMCDTIGMEINVTSCVQAGALGAVIHAAVIGGIYPSTAAAQMSICAPVIKIYKVNEERRKFLMKRFEMYKELEVFSEKNFK
jgi:L-ribulokinase